MLTFEAKHVLSIQPVQAKPYDFKNDDGQEVKGTSIKGVVTALGTDDRVAVITVKGKTIEEAQRKLEGMALTVGKPAKIRIEGAVSGGVLQLRA